MDLREVVVEPAAPSRRSGVGSSLSRGAAEDRATVAYANRGEELAFGVTSLGPRMPTQGRKTDPASGKAPENLRRFTIGIIEARGLKGKPATLRLNRKLKGCPQGSPEPPTQELQGITTDSL